MADDSMEISSDHGHDADDEDIDIDIDLTAGQADGDYIIEDATANVDFDNPNPQPSLSVGNDDLMVDEDDDGSYPMYDAELVHDEREPDMEHELAITSFLTADAPHFDVNEHADTTHLPVEDSNVANELMWDQGDSSGQGVEQNDVRLEYPEDTLNDEGEQTNDQSVDKIVESTKTFSDRASRTVSPRNDTPGSAAGEAPRSPPTSNPDPRPTSPEQLNDHPDQDLTPHNVSSDVREANKDASLEDMNGLPLRYNAAVVYQSIEYTLFGIPDSDDPDSFFLSDTFIAEQSISNFFKAIRDVIHEDLTDKDELCISIEDLGLELEETAASLQDVTLAQILSLHEKLMQNDGVESPRPLSIILATRPSFAKRLANLMVGASEGKGISELIIWDEQSEGLEVLGELDELTQDDYTVDDVEVPGEAIREELRTADSDEFEDVDANLPSDGLVDHKHKQTAHSGNALEYDDDEDLSPVPVAGPAQDKPQADEFHVVQDSSKNEHFVHGDVDEDGDLIDYSDEDIQDPGEQRGVGSGTLSHYTDNNRSTSGTSTNFISPCLKPNTCFCSKCSDLLVAEYEAINEELRRRSISRTAEGNHIEETTNQNSVNSGGDDQLEVTDFENGVEYDENYEAESDHKNDDREQEDLTDEDAGIANGLAKHNDEPLIHDDLSGEVEAAVTEHMANYGNEPGVQEEHGLSRTSHEPYGDEDELVDEYEIQTHDLLQLEAELAPLNGVPTLGNGKSDNFNHPQQANSTASSVGLIDVAVSSATVSVDEIRYEDEQNSSGGFKQAVELDFSTEQDNTTNVDQGDEIDYEDDEDDKEQDSAGAGQAPEAIEKFSAMNEGLGKRARADADSDDAVVTRSKDAKRARS